MPKETAPLKEIVAWLRDTYCGQIGIEYMGTENLELEEWIQQRIEPSRFKVELPLETKRRILDLLNHSELFEKFLHTKFVGQKRFSLEGGETLIPIIATLILMVAGRGLAQLITEGLIITINSSPYKLIGAGFWLTVPFSIIVALAVTGAAALLTRRTALGMIVESVGGNAEASRLAGVRSRRIILLVYVISGLFGLSQGGIVPSYALIIRQYFPAREAGGRIGLVLMSTVLGMALGGWLSGEIYDLTGSYQAAFLNGIAWNLLNMSIAFWLLMSRRRPGRAAA